MAKDSDHAGWKGTKQKEKLLWIPFDHNQSLKDISWHADKHSDKKLISEMAETSCRWHTDWLMEQWGMTPSCQRDGDTWWTQSSPNNQVAAQCATMQIWSMWWQQAVRRGLSSEPEHRDWHILTDHMVTVQVVNMVKRLTCLGNVDAPWDDGRPSRVL